MLTKEARDEMYQAGVQAAIEEIFGKEAGVMAGVGRLVRPASKMPSVMADAGSLMSAATKTPGAMGAAVKSSRKPAGIFEKAKHIVKAL